MKKLTVTQFNNKNYLRLFIVEGSKFYENTMLIKDGCLDVVKKLVSDTKESDIDENIEDRFINYLVIQR